MSSFWVHPLAMYIVKRCSTLGRIPEISRNFHARQESVPLSEYNRLTLPAIGGLSLILEHCISSAPGHEHCTVQHCTVFLRDIYTQKNEFHVARHAQKQPRRCRATSGDMKFVFRVNIPFKTSLLKTSWRRFGGFGRGGLSRLS
jgi:hypothetical protein